MKAWVLEAPDKLSFKDIKIPSCGENQVLIELESAAICNGSDPALLKGHAIARFPVVFGHEPCGTIVKAGKRVEGFAVSDRVTWWFSMGAFAEYVVVDPSAVAMVKVPKAIPSTQAPVLELVAASLRAVKAIGPVAGKRVLIIGLGPSGLTMSQRLVSKGAETVVGWDIHERRRALGRRLGCVAAFDPSDPGVVQKTNRVCRQFDVIIDAFANDTLPGRPTFNNALSMLTDRGTIVTYGHPTEGRNIDMYLYQVRGASMKCPVNDLIAIRRLQTEALSEIRKGRLQIQPLVTDVLPLERLIDGLRLIAEDPNEHMKVILKIKGGQGWIAELPDGVDA